MPCLGDIAYIYALFKKSRVVILVVGFSSYYHTTPKYDVKVRGRRPLDLLGMNRPSGYKVLPRASLERTQELTGQGCYFPYFCEIKWNHMEILLFNDRLLPTNLKRTIRTEDNY